MNRRLYALHRWLSALALVQLALWTISGALFVFLPIDLVRGAPVKGAHAASLHEALTPAALAKAQEQARQANLGDLTAIELRATPAGTFLLVRGARGIVRLGAASGEIVPVSDEEAKATASRDQPAHPAAGRAELLREDAPIDYRGKPLPAWRVELTDDNHTVVYVDATTGEVTARRNRYFRVYDLFWSLHIMDYHEREGFNHGLIRLFAVLGLGTVISGAVLWVLRMSRWRRRRSGAPPARPSD